LDLNGKKIFFQNTGTLKTLNRAIFMNGKSKVYDSKNGAIISDFYNGIDIYGDNNEVHNLSIENTLYGIQVNGHNNKMLKVSAKNIGGIIDSQNTIIIGEGKGFVVNGNYNKLTDTKTRNIGFKEDNYALVDSMVGSAASISITGNDNIIEQHNAENIYALTKADRNAQATAWGVYIKGNNNKIEHGSINKVDASSTRIVEQGLETYDYMENEDSSKNQTCRNDWLGNDLSKNATFYPKICFPS
jgi:hypothetical protein